MTDQSHSGGCRCGRVRFETNGRPRFVANCHCDSCRRATGAAFATWVGFPVDQVAWSGKAPGLFRPSRGVERGFCPACGTPLSYSGARWPDEIHLTIGAFDHPEAFTPQGDAFAEEALPWTRPSENSSA